MLLNVLSWYLIILSLSQSLNLSISIHFNARTLWMIISVC